MGLLLITIGALLVFLALSIRHIPADPPHVAAVTFLGRRTGATKAEGYRLFPFYPFVYNGILVRITREHQELQPQRVRSRDLGELEVVVSVTWTPDRRYIRPYLDYDGKDGIKEALESVVRERLREWASERDWEAVVSAKDEATAMLVRDVVGLPPHLAPEDERELVRQVRLGNGVQPIPSLGIVLNRLNIREIIPASELVQAVGLRATKTRQRDAERIDVAWLQEVRKQLGCSLEEAAELIHTDRRVVDKKIRQIKGGISNETLEAVKGLLDRAG